LFSEKEGCLDRLARSTAAVIQTDAILFFQKRKDEVWFGLQQSFFLLREQSRSDFSVNTTVRHFVFGKRKDEV
jgi:hypothetical protein